MGHLLLQILLHSDGVSKLDEYRSHLLQRSSHAKRHDELCNAHLAIAVLFPCRCVSSSVLESASIDLHGQPQQASSSPSIRAFLSGLFIQLCSGQGHLSQTGLMQQPCVMAAAARLVGDYALWFSNFGGPEVPLEAALQMLLQAFRLPQVQMLLVSPVRSFSSTTLYHKSHLLWKA